MWGLRLSNPMMKEAQREISGALSHRGEERGGEERRGEERRGEVGLTPGLERGAARGV